MKPTCFVGIDVGFTGGIAAIVEGAPMPALWDMPASSFTVKKRRKVKSAEGTSVKSIDGTETVLDVQRIKTIFESLMEYEVFVLIETAQVRPAMPGKKQAQGVVSQAKFYGQMTEIRGLLVGLGIAFEQVHSATWKADIFRGQIRSDEESAKEQSRLKAIQMFPVLASRLQLKKTHGVAEALLIADWGRRRHFAPF